MIIYSIGHSTRSFDEFSRLLVDHGIKTLADIRQFPFSRRFRQFNREALQERLAALSIRYLHLPKLGGRRKPAKDSPNSGWKVAAFRGYADYMQTAGFEEGIRRLLDSGKEGPLAFMCAEAVPWRCHRTLVSDALVMRGHEVRHILGPDQWKPHRITSFAKEKDGKPIYPRTEPQQKILSFAGPGT